MTVLSAWTTSAPGQVTIRGTLRAGCGQLLSVRHGIIGPATEDDMVVAFVRAEIGRRDVL